MDFDLLFVTGLALVAFAIPSAVSAYADWRWPKAAIILLILGGVAMAYAAQENPGAYALDTVDDVIVSVVGDLLNN
ncbi:hypothetical protein [Roseobacter sp. CCS2]|uniref:hypothetical protein n=1 Tax=Roseobacter sp. CCS2 TaxID=391593 RepID=UPI0000F40447|nr:hypothetical protein [Roseobacter sp. CCS2]EBA13671.1 hypothetical protein RCCS2_07279 [Roseobacter sp. CCS2]